MGPRIGTAIRKEMLVVGAPDGFRWDKKGRDCQFEERTEIEA